MSTKEVKVVVNGSGAESNREVLERVVASAPANKIGNHQAVVVRLAKRGSLLRGFVSVARVL